MCSHERAVTVRDSAVMGRDALLNTSLWLAAAAVVQLLGFPGSRAITEAAGREFDVAWACTLLLAAAAAATARRVGRVPAREGIASTIEVGGATLLVIGLGIYVGTLLFLDRGPAPASAVDYPYWVTVLEGRLVIVALAGAAITNTLGRVALLTRRLRIAPRLRDHA